MRQTEVKEDCASTNKGQKPENKEKERKTKESIKIIHKQQTNGSKLMSF